MKFTNNFVEALARLENGTATELDKNKISGVMQAFNTEPRKIHGAKVQAMKKSGLQAFGTSADFDDLLRGAFNVTTESLNYDMFWQEAFRKVEVGANRNFWQIYTVASGLAFQKVPEGGRVQVDKLTGDKVQVFVEKYGGALGWTDEMIRFREVAAINDKALEFANKFYSYQADQFYTLLAAASALNITAYQGVVADGELQRDIQTINQAIYDISDANKDKGYGDAANAPLVIYANLLDQRRIEPAFQVSANSLAAAGRTGQSIMRNVRRYYTMNTAIVSGAPVLVMPGQKIQWAEVLPPTTFTDKVDILTLNMAQSVWSYYGGAVGDTDQARRISLS